VPRGPVCIILTDIYSSLCLYVFSSTSSEEHLFELVLPKPCSVGHIDVKFCFNSLCTAPPNIQVNSVTMMFFYLYHLVCVMLSIL